MMDHLVNLDQKTVIYPGKRYMVNSIFLGWCKISGHTCCLIHRISINWNFVDQRCFSLLQDVFVSSDGEDSFDAKSDDVSGNGASGSGRDDTGHGKDDDAESDDSRTVVEESDSSEDEVCPPPPPPGVKKWKVS